MDGGPRLAVRYQEPPAVPHGPHRPHVLAGVRVANPHLKVLQDVLGDRCPSEQRAVLTRHHMRHLRATMQCARLIDGLQLATTMVASQALQIEHCRVVALIGLPD